MIKVNKLSKVFLEGTKKEFLALDNVNFSISKNECVLIKGVSGSGKSTPSSILGAMSKPTSGEVLIEGVNYAKLSDDKASDFRLNKIGFIFQSYHLIEDLTLVQNIKTPLICKKLSEAEKLEKIEAAKIVSNILDKDNIMAKDLSGGEKQRCAIARALVLDPDIIIADEPTANLDRDNSLRFIEAMRRLKSLGKTIIISTHDEIFDDNDLADSVIKMEYGKNI